MASKPAGSIASASDSVKVNLSQILIISRFVNPASRIYTSRGMGDETMANPRTVDPQALKIVLYPDPVLRETAQPIEKVTPQIQAIARRMIALMHDAPGVGLAAPQVGLPWRMFVANPTGDERDDAVFINPVLKNAGTLTEGHNEGCLSLPGVNAEIRRPKEITIEALDLEGKPFTMTSDELPARIWQHEFDHLEGVLIIDKMTPLDRKANKAAIADLEYRANR